MHAPAPPLVALALLSACSLSMHGPGDARRRVAAPVCDDDARRPVTDLAIAGAIVAVGVLAAVATMAIPNGDKPGDLNAGGLIVAGGGLVVFGGPAIYGFETRRSCGEAKAHWAEHPVPAEDGANEGACRAARPLCNPGLTCDARVCVVE
jgi:hypothetical protein